MLREVHISRTDGEPWLPLASDHVQGTIEIDEWVLSSRDSRFHVVMLENGLFLGMQSDSLEAVLAGGGWSIPVNMLAISAWPTWGLRYERLLAPGVGLCRVVISK